MTDNDTGNGSSREDLLQRVALMELMIAEGRRSTARFGWIFVLWGLVDIFGMGWQMYEPSYWVWPIAIGCGLVLQFAGMALRRNRGQWCSTTLKSRSISAVWSMMGLATSLYCFTGIFSQHTDGVAYIAAIFMFVGLAHAISSLILRWGVQGFVASTWWAGGIAAFFIDSNHGFFYLFMAEMLFGMVFFGFYAMWLERQTPSASSTTPVQHHA